MGNQKREINPRDQAGVAGRFFTDVNVIDNVTDKEKARCDQGDDHARDVALPDVAPDPKPARRNENGADRVEGRIDRGKIRNCHATDSHR